AWREEVARVKRAAYAGEEYWGRPLPGFGDPRARLLILGLAPAAHGGNRTGRIFTGDRSGDWLFAALWRSGYANQPESVSREDGLALRDCYVTASVRCAPPANRPLTSERDNCLRYLERELTLLAGVQVIMCLGGFAWDAGAIRSLRELDQRLGAAHSLTEVLDSLAEAITIRDPSNRIVFANRAAVEQMGFGSREELLGRPPQSIFDDYVVRGEDGREL